MLFAIMLCCGLTSVVSMADDTPTSDAKSSNVTTAKKTMAKRTTPPQKLFTGKVVFLREALKRKGIKAFSEFDKQVALETPDGELIPIIPDWRGRAFYQDKRLRNRKVDLVGYRRKGVPYLQVLMAFAYNEKGERQYMDYWCDICAIPMYEIKPCDCCQAPIELRFQTRDLPDYLSKKPDAKLRFLKGRGKTPPANTDQ
jgi:hypothetical protein